MEVKIFVLGENESYAKEVEQKLRNSQIDAEYIFDNRRLNEQIRESKKYVSYFIIIGTREFDNKTISMNRSNSKLIKEYSINEAIEIIIASRNLEYI